MRYVNDTDAMDVKVDLFKANNPYPDIGSKSSISLIISLEVKV